MKRIVATLTGLGMVLAGVTLSACGENTDEGNLPADDTQLNNGDGLTIGDIESVIQDEEAWGNAFENIAYTNYTMLVRYSEQGHSTENYCEITENAVYVRQEFRTYYSVKNADGTYTTYMNEQGDSSYENFVLLNDTSDEYFVGIKNESLIIVSYADYFDLFTYDGTTAAYSYSGEIATTVHDYSGTYEDELICYNIVVKVLNNRIIAISSDYRLDDESFKGHFEYFDIGTTAVTVPQEIVDNAKLQK